MVNFILCAPSRAGDPSCLVQLLVVVVVVGGGGGGKIASHY